MLASSIRVAAVVGCAIAALASASSRHDTVRQVKRVDYVGVSVVPADAVAGWMITVRNNREDQIMLLWDESTYVNTAGVSGRLIRGNTRVIHSDRDQPPSPIPPRSKLISFAVPEEHAEYVTTNRSMPEWPGKEGRLRLVFETDDGKLTWVGAVRWGKQ